MRIWFHGTDKDAAREILKKGFQSETYFSAPMEDAIEFGGMFVF